MCYDKHYSEAIASFRRFYMWTLPRSAEAYDSITFDIILYYLGRLLHWDFIKTHVAFTPKGPRMKMAMNMLLPRLFLTLICAEMISRLGELMPPDMNPNNASVCCYSQSYPTDLSKLILMERPTSASMTHSQLRESL